MSKEDLSSEISSKEDYWGDLDGENFDSAGNPVGNTDAGNINGGVLGGSGGAVGRKYPAIKVDFKPSAADKDSVLFTNPDRGFRFESYTSLAAGNENVNRWNINQWNSKFKAAADMVNTKLWAKPKLTQVYCYLTEYKDTATLPTVVFDNLDIIFSELKKEGMKAVLRFAYQEDMNRKEEQASQSVMLSHMNQLAPALEKHKTLIHTVEAGFLGAWGEWHSYPGHSWSNQEQISNQYFDGKTILKAILNMVPDEIYVQARYPGINDLLDNSDPDKQRLGSNNDAFFGYRSLGEGWPYTEMGNDACQKANAISLKAPMGGEFFWGCQWDKADVTAEQAIRMFAYFNQNSFSIFHNSFEGTPEVAGSGEGALWFATSREGDMSKWARVGVTAEQLKNWGAFVSPSYFKNSSGSSAYRNAFEYVRDHLGYRIEAKNLSISAGMAKSSTVSLSMNLVNYGFSAAYNMTGEFVVLDSKNSIVSRVKAGNPASWENDSNLKTHTVVANLKMPDKSGKYKIAYYLHNSLGEGAYFANDITRTAGFNILYEIEI